MSGEGFIANDFRTHGGDSAIDDDETYQERVQTVLDHAEERTKLLEARRRVAARYPGCASAILRDDPDLNWDRGRVIQQEIANLSETADFSARTVESAVETGRTREMAAFARFSPK